MRALAIALACLATACASTYTPNPNDPVDMAAELGNRGAQYIGMGEVCDNTAGGNYRVELVLIVQTQEARLGVLSDLVRRAYRGHATDELAQHMRTQMLAHGYTASDFCAELMLQAESELQQRGAQILGLSAEPDIMHWAREAQAPAF